MQKNSWIKFMYRQLGDKGMFSYHTASGYVDRVYPNGDFKVSVSTNFGNLIYISHVAVVGAITERAS